MIAGLATNTHEAQEQILAWYPASDIFVDMEINGYAVKMNGTKIGEIIRIYDSWEWTVDDLYVPKTIIKWTHGLTIR